VKLEISNDFRHITYLGALADPIFAVALFNVTLFWLSFSHAVVNLKHTYRIELSLLGFEFKLGWDGRSALRYPKEKDLRPKVGVQRRLPVGLLIVLAILAVLVVGVVLDRTVLEEVLR